MSAQPKSSSGGKGCFFYGCLTSIVLFLVGVLVLVFGTRYFFHRVVDTYTSKTPLTFPEVKMSEDHIKDVESRVSDFNAAMNAGTNAPALVLTADEINALFAHDTNFTAFKGSFFVKIDGNKLSSTASMPAENFGLTSLKGRYINGTVGLTVTTTNGQVVVKIASFEVNGQPLPPNFLAGLQSKNLLEGVYNDPKNSGLTNMIDSVEVKDGKLIITPHLPEPKKEPKKEGEIKI